MRKAKSGRRGSNEKRVRDISVNAPIELIVSNVSVDGPKEWIGSNEKKVSNVSVDGPKGWIGSNEKKVSNVAVDGSKEWKGSNEKKVSNVAVDGPKGWIGSNEKKVSNVSVDGPKEWKGNNEKKVSNVSVDGPKEWKGINEQKARVISVDNQKGWGTNNENKAKYISVEAPKERIVTNEKRARVISVVTQKGGVGKTATAINMSVGLQNLGYKVAAIDLDPQGQLAEGFGIDRKALKKTMLDVLLGMADMKGIKKKAYGVDLYLSNRSLANLGVTVQALSNVKQYPDPSVLLKNALAQIDTKYDFIIIDTPPTVSIFNTNALNASTDAVIPMQPEGMAVKGAEDMIEFIREVQKSSNNKLNILGILATMVQNTNLHNTVMQEVRKSFIKSDITVFDTVIKRTIRYGSAQTEGVPDTKSFPEYTEFLKEALFGETA